MTYFYEKAKRGADPALRPVDAEDFRYPGPKPQTREAAIFMLADGVEAAARTVDDPTPNRLREIIRQITSAIVLDGQLDDCDLTFADLEQDPERVPAQLVSMYHQRVDYPGFDFAAAERRGEARRRAARARRAGGGAIVSGAAPRLLRGAVLNRQRARRVDRDGARRASSSADPAELPPDARRPRRGLPGLRPRACASSTAAFAARIADRRALLPGGRAGSAPRGARTWATS